MSGGATAWKLLGIAARAFLVLPQIRKITQIAGNQIMAQKTPKLNISMRFMYIYA